MIKTSIIILTRNEIDGVRVILNRLPKIRDSEIFAVDYDSQDGTVAYLRAHHIRVVRQSQKGRGEAFAIGAAKARGKYLLFFSPDGNEDPADIPRLITLLEKGNDLAIASRFMTGSRNEEDDEVFKFRAWANRAFTFFVHLFFGGHVSDTINGYRAIRRDVYKSLHLNTSGFAIEFQMTIRALKRGKKIAEIPTREGNRIGGQSTAYAIPTGLQFVLLLLREIFIGLNF
ncbi:glycosyltransferase family 2 protein [Candidatus Gottesmanbacteria bacterium]|nr:glycosyltransferase family 2 protein [Candidatus Gottesmanbacteria bacterium]